MSRILKIGLASLAVMMLMAGCEKKVPAGQTSVAEKSSEVMGQTPEKAPAFTLIDHNGKTHHLSDYTGKVVVLEWLNPECPFTIRHYEAKTMLTLANSYADRGVVWLGISSTGHLDSVRNKAFAEHYNLPYAVLDDHTGQVGRLYDAKTTPHLFVIDTAGVLAYRGAIDDDPTGAKAEKVNYVEAALDELLAGKDVTIKETQSYGCSVKYAQ